MKRITLISASETHFSALNAYKHAFIQSGKTSAGGSCLEHFADDELDCWLAYINAPAGTNLFGFDKVADSTYLAWHIELQKIVGIINIRHELNDRLYQVGGHIGYSIHPNYWNQGLATEMLGLALQEVDKLKINNVLITCDKQNQASAKVIQKNGGVLENEITIADRTTQRYWIKRAFANA